MLLFAELGVVLFLSARISKMSVVTARVLFFVYAILNGIVFSAYFYVYDLMILWSVFLLTSLFFGVMALIGYFANVNFSGIRPFMTGGLIFLCGFWVLSLFINLSAFETIACTVGIFIFLLFTAYDTKKIKAYYEYYGRRRRWRPRLRFSPRFSCTWILSTCSCTSCGSLAERETNTFKSAAAGPLVWQLCWMQWTAGAVCGQIGL